MERRRGWAEFEDSLKTVLADNKEHTAGIKAARAKQEEVIRSVANAEAKVEGLSKGFDRLSDNIERITEQAITARLNSEEAKLRIEKHEETQQTLAKLVERHDAEIENLKRPWKGWVVAGAGVTLLFILFFIDAEAAGSAVSALKGVFQ